VVPNACRRSWLLIPKFGNQNQGYADRIGTLHDLRFVIFDNDTRLFFATTFDDDWDAYINDFATLIPDLIDIVFEEVEDYPGIKSPNIKDYIVKSQVTATYFYSAYPEHRCEIYGRQ
jgi:hypothetical protein